MDEKPDKPEKTFLGDALPSWLWWWLVMAFIYLWPFAVWRGQDTEWAVGIPWLAVSVGASIAIHEFKRRRRR